MRNGSYMRGEDDRPAPFFIWSFPRHRCVLAPSLRGLSKIFDF